MRRDSTQGTSSGNYNSISADVSGDSEPLSASSLSVYGTVLSPVSVAEADASLSAYSGGVAENTALAEGRGRVADVYRTIKSNRYLYIFLQIPITLINS